MVKISITLGGPSCMQSQQELCIRSSTTLHAPSSHLHAASSGATSLCGPCGFNISLKMKLEEKLNQKQLSTGQSEEEVLHIQVLPIAPRDAKGSFWLPNLLTEQRRAPELVEDFVSLTSRWL